MSEPRVPDVMGEVIGWRAWQLVGSIKVPRLMSINAASHSVSHEDAIWPTKRWFTARCSKGHIEDIPVEECTCGLYAARDREQLVKLAYGSYGPDQINVIGEVGFAGKVIPGSQGYRAERGRIRSLILPYEFWRYAPTLEAAYKAPVSVGFLFPESVRNEVLGG